MKRSMAAMFTFLFAMGCDNAPTDQTAPSSAEAPGPLAALTGTWQLYPAQSTTYATSVQQPINADKSSNFKANGKAVIPVKFALSAGAGPAVFQSIGSDVATANDYSHLSFTPGDALTFNDITTLSALYDFTTGDCHGGSLRWVVRTSANQALSIYYGGHPEFGNGGVNGCTAENGGDNQSGEDLLDFDDLRYDTSQYPGGTFYDTKAHALTLMGTMPVTRVSLILDSGWQEDQVLTLTSATVNENTFTPAPASALSPTCNLPPATIKITKADASPSGAVNEPLSIQPSDNDLNFRTVDCKYMYNLATSSLSGVGTYTISAVIGGVSATEPAGFDLK